MLACPIVRKQYRPGHGEGIRHGVEHQPVLPFTGPLLTQQAGVKLVRGKWITCQCSLEQHSIRSIFLNMLPMALGRKNKLKGGGGRQSLIRQRKRKWGQKGQTDREMNRGRDGAGNSCSLHSKLWWTNLKHKHTHTLWGTHRHQVTYLHICVEVHTRWQQGVQRVAKQSHQFLLVPLLPFLAPKDKKIYKAICQPQDSWVPHKKVY